MRVAIVFASKGGQTGKIARYMEERLLDQGHSVQLINASLPSQFFSPNIDTIIFGSPVYKGKFCRSLISWVQRHRALLEHTTSALFSVSLNAADKHAYARADDDRLLREFMAKCGWIPDYAASIAGALKYRDYNWIIRFLMKRISAKAGGDTDTSKNFEYTDWSQIDAFLDAVVLKQPGTFFNTELRFANDAAIRPQARRLEQAKNASIEGSLPRRRTNLGSHLLTIFLSLLVAGASPAAMSGDLPLLTEQDMYALAQKAGKSIRKCKAIRGWTGVIVGVENQTGEVIDKTRFAELIHSNVEGKTHAVPEAKPPQYEIKAILTAEKQSGKLLSRSTYKLSIEVLQENERLCKKSVTISKRIDNGSSEKRSN